MVNKFNDVMDKHDTQYNLERQAEFDDSFFFKGRFE